jgi:hypothetical protein
MNSKNPIVVITFSAIVICVLYYMMSPYKICMRDKADWDDQSWARATCQTDTSW